MRRARHPYLNLVAAAVATAALSGAPSTLHAVCVGDCNANGIVTIAETQRCVNLASNIPSEPCSNADQAGDGVTPDDVDACVQSFLDAATCPMVFTPVATATPATPVPTNTPPSTNTPVPTDTPNPTNTVPPAATDTPIPEPSATNTAIPEIGDVSCALAAASQIRIFSTLLNQSLMANGSLDVDCGVPNASTGEASCSCGVAAPGFGPLDIGPGLFVACVKPATAACPAGKIDCDGGSNLGLQLTGNTDITNNNPGNTNPCSGNVDCAADCAVQCGGAASVFQSGCDGFCSGGTQGPCTNDASCLPDNGACNGQDGQPRGNQCNCTCIDDAVAPAAGPGGFACRLGFNLTVESPAGTPCDGVNILINIGDTCAPLTTQSVSAVLNNANDNGGPLPTAALGGVFTGSGTAVSCDQLRGDDPTGFSLVGSAMFYGSTVGDINTGLMVTCE